MTDQIQNTNIIPQSSENPETQKIPRGAAIQHAGSPFKDDPAPKINLDSSPNKDYVHQNLETLGRTESPKQGGTSHHDIRHDKEAAVLNLTHHHEHIKEPTTDLIKGHKPLVQEIPQKQDSDQKVTNQQNV